MNSKIDECRIALRNAAAELANKSMALKAARQEYDEASLRYLDAHKELMIAEKENKDLA